jgi:hypothetical protein
MTAAAGTEKIRLEQVEILSCYFSKAGERLYLPARMAYATPRMKKAIYALREEIRSLGADLILSDLYRNTDMQAAAHRRYMASRSEWETKGRVGAPPKYSPPAGYSFHEAGEAMDVDLRALLPIANGAWKNVLDVFWPLARKHSFRPIIRFPDEGRSEAWHFDFWDAEREKLYRENSVNGNGYRVAASQAIAAVDRPPYAAPAA